MTAPLVPPAPTNKLTLAGFVASRVQIQSIFQHSASYERIDDLSEDPESLEMKTHVQTSLTHEKNQIVATIHFGARAETKSHREYVKIESVYIAIYSIEDMSDLTEQHINAFGEVNGTYNVWPYWREFVQSTTVRMALNPLTLPVHRPLERVPPTPPLPKQPSPQLKAPKAKPTSKRSTARD